jgi:lipopolysaccharide/colanic/teichoic acid biosynthesis glycosyltransferase
MRCLTSSKNSRTEVMFVGKRLFDISISIVGGLLLLPLALFIALLILAFDGWPVFFRQERVGYKGHAFHIYKFRTMVRDAERLGKQLTVGWDERITRLGYLLRKFKLDELPQLINVLRGEMSLVGPRPEVPRYVALYDIEQRRVLDLIPGITDPASIAFSDEASMLAGSENPERLYVERIMPEKIRLNLSYAERAGFFSDFGVILRTLAILWKKSSENA